MLATGGGQVTVDVIRESLEVGKSLFDRTWLEKEFRKPPGDPLLMTRRMPVTPGQQMHRIRYEQSDHIHALAEAVLAGEEILAEHRRSGLLQPSNRIYLLLSLRDVGLVRHRIVNADTRIAKLTSDDWRAPLYELLIAASYLHIGGVTLVPEGATPTPDIRVESDPPVYVECKAKTQHEEQVRRFVQAWREQALGKIAALTKTVNAGFLIKILIKKPGSLPSIAKTVEEMVHAGQEQHETTTAQIDIQCFDPAPAQPPRPMSLPSSEFWKWAMDFDERDAWHFVLEGGNFQFASVPNLIVKEVSRPVIVCVRAAWLAGNTQDIYGPLKDACRKQLRNHQPGILHMRIDTSLFALEARRNVGAVKELLTEVADEIFRDYSRVSRIDYDIVTPPYFQGFVPIGERLELGNRRAKTDLKTFGKPLPVLML